MRLSDTAIRRPVTTVLMTVALIIFGGFSLTSIGVDLFPEVDFPVITIIAILPGADPEIMDTDVADILEEQIKTIEGVKTIRSTSTESRAQVIVQFVLGKDVDVAAQEVRAKINVAQADLPLDLETPIVDKVDVSSMPILWIATTSRGDYRTMANYVDDVMKPRLQTVPGVGAILLSGFRDREVRVWIDPLKLEALNLTPLDVARAIRAKHIELPGGRIERPDIEYSVKVEGEYQTIDELQALVIRSEDNTVTRLSDVARIEDSSEDLRSLARYNGRTAIGLGIRKQAGTNTVAIAQSIIRELETLKQTAPSEIELHLAFDSSEFIANSMNDVLFDLLLGGILCGAVMLIFLRNFRMTLISLVTIPATIIGCFAIMYAMGFTINNMTLLALSLSIGMVIDDAIVVQENIFRRMENLQESRVEASHRGTSEVGFAVIATSLAILGVFIPVAFMQGIIGQFFFQFGLTVVAAVAISTIFALTLTPMLCSRILRTADSHGLVFRTLERGFELVETLYAGTLDRALTYRWGTIAIAISLSIAGLMLIPFVNKSFVTDADEGRFMVRFEFPTGTAITSTEAGLDKIEDFVRALPEVQGAFSFVGTEGTGVNGGTMFVTLVPKSERTLGQVDVMAILRREFAKVDIGALTSVESVSPLGATERSTELQYVVTGPTLPELTEAINGMMSDLRQEPGLVDLDTNLRLNKPEIQITINRDLADDLGVDVRNITENINILFGGQDVATFKDAGQRFDIRLRADPKSRTEPSDLLHLALRGNGGELIQAPNLIDYQVGIGPNSINRYNRSRSGTIFTNFDGIDQATGLRLINEAFEANVPNEPGWSSALTGRTQYFVESFGYMLIALGMSIVLTYIILGSQFESFIHPFTVLMSVPLAGIGGLGLIFVWDKYLDIFAFIGFIMLVGIVSKNAILLVDITNQQRAKGLSIGDALRTAGPLRLRPILMTALTTMAALLPVALARSEGGEQRVSMGVVVIGGMFTSTFLTLLVVPCVYSVMDDLSRLITGLFSDDSSDHPKAEPIGQEQENVK